MWNPAQTTTEEPFKKEMMACPGASIIDEDGTASQPYRKVPIKEQVKCAFDNTRRICVEVLDSEFKPLLFPGEKQGEAIDYWQLTDQKFYYDNVIRARGG